MRLTTQLSPQQEKFACEVAKGKSQSEAYRNAYPHSKNWKDEAVWVKSSELAKLGKVKVRISDLMRKSFDKNDITIERILKERARLAFSDVRKLYNEDGTLKPIHELDDDTAAAISGLDVVTLGNDQIGFATVNKIKLADKNPSLTALEKCHGLYKDDNKGGSILNIMINLN